MSYRKEHSKTRISPEFEAEIVRLWLSGVRSPSEISNRLGIPRTSIQNVIKRNGFELNAAKSTKHDVTADLGSSEIKELKEILAQQQAMIQALLNGEIKTKAGQAPIVQPCELRKRRCDSSENRRVLLISDLHAPYQHPDAIDFLEALQKKYRFDRVINLGDELDYHAASFHTSEPGAHGAARELELGRQVMRQLHEIFDEMDLVESNHGSMAFRKAKEGGLPKHLITPYRDAVFGEDDGNGGLWRPNGIGDGWRWHPTLTIEIPNSSAPLYVAHGIAADPRNALRRMHTHIAQGHYHTEFSIRYEANPHTGMLFGISGGCLIDDNQVAFAYNKNTPARPSIGCAGIIEGVPTLFPMLRDKKNRWIGLVP